VEFNEVCKTIISLRWEKEYEKALELFRKEIHEKVKPQSISGIPKLVNAIADSLRETGKIPNAIRFIEDYLGITISQDTDMSIVRNVAWLYYFALKPQKPLIDISADKTDDRINRLLDELVRIGEQKVFELIFYRYLELLAKQTPTLVQQADTLLEKFVPTQFTIDSQVFTTTIKGKSKEVEMASGYEKWFMWRTKIDYSLGNYQRCIDICKQALSEVNRFHYGNQHWLARRIALSYKQTGDIPQAIHELEKLLKHRNEWFIQKELAELYFLNSNLDTAIKLTNLAFVNSGYCEYKAGLFELMGDILMAKGDSVNALRLFQLTQAVRKSKGWPISQTLQSKLGNHAQYESNDPTLIYKDLLKATPSNELPTQQVKHGTGKVTRILHPGENGDGFITDTEGLSVYFRFCNCRIPWNQLHEGVEVGFAAKEVDRKGKKSWQAVKVFELSKQTSGKK